MADFMEIATSARENGCLGTACPALVYVGLSENQGEVLTNFDCDAASDATLERSGGEYGPSVCPLPFAMGAMLAEFQRGEEE